MKAKTVSANDQPKHDNHPTQRSTKTNRKQHRKTRNTTTQTEKKLSPKRRSLPDGRSNPSIEALAFWGKEPSDAVTPSAAGRSVNRAKSLLQERQIHSVHSIKNEDSSPAELAFSYSRPVKLQDTGSGGANLSIKGSGTAQDQKKASFKSNPSPLALAQSPLPNNKLSKSKSNCKKDTKVVHTKPSRSNCTLNAVSSLTDMESSSVQLPVDSAVLRSDEVKVKQICHTFEELGRKSECKDSSKLVTIVPCVAHSSVQCDIRQQDCGVTHEVHGGQPELCDSRVDTKLQLIERAVMDLQKSVSGMAVALDFLRSRSSLFIADGQQLHALISTTDCRHDVNSECESAKTINSDESLRKGRQLDVNESAGVETGRRSEDFDCVNPPPVDCGSCQSLRSSLEPLRQRSKSVTSTLSATSGDIDDSKLANPNRQPTSDCELDDTGCCNGRTELNKKCLDDANKPLTSEVVQDDTAQTSGQPDCIVGRELLGNEMKYGHQYTDPDLSGIDSDSHHYDASSETLSSSGDTSYNCSNMEPYHIMPERASETHCRASHSSVSSSDTSQQCHTSQHGVVLPQRITKPRKSWKERLAKAFRWRRQDSVQSDRNNSDGQSNVQMSVDELFENLPPPAKKNTSKGANENKRHRSRSRSSRTSIPISCAPSLPQPFR